MNTQQDALLRRALSEYVRPGLSAASDAFNSISRQHLVLGTGYKESGYVHTVQIGGGPALGFFQMEPETYRDTLINFVAFRPDLQKAIFALTGSHAPDVQTLITKPAFAALMCGIKYLRSPIPLPAPFDAFGQACIWKKAYNGPGKGVISDAVQYFRTANEVF